MTTLTNSAEGGTNGTGATTGNTGGASGNAADAITTSATCTVTFDNTHAAHGVLSYKMLYGGTAGNVAFDWAASMGTQSQIWFRLYLFLTANPPINLRFWGCKAATACANLVINNAGKLVFFNASGTQLIISTNTVPLNAWFRVEGFVIGSATAGQVEFKLFDTPDSATPTETETSSATANTNTSPTTYIFGNEGVTTSSYTYWQDDLGLSSTGYLGPVVTAGSPVRPLVIVPAARPRRAIIIVPSRLAGAVRPVPVTGRVMIPPPRPRPRGVAIGPRSLLASPPPPVPGKPVLIAPVQLRPRGRGRAVVIQPITVRTVIPATPVLIASPPRRPAPRGRAVVVQLVPVKPIPPARVVIADDGDAPWHIRIRRRRT